MPDVAPVVSPFISPGINYGYASGYTRKVSLIVCPDDARIVCPECFPIYDLGVSLEVSPDLTSRISSTETPDMTPGVDEWTGAGAFSAHFQPSDV
jgi:hypothetical protein